jgi:hypothetical protein
MKLVSLRYDPSFVIVYSDVESDGSASLVDGRRPGAWNRHPHLQSVALIGSPKRIFAVIGRRGEGGRNIILGHDFYRTSQGFFWTVKKP